MIESGPGHGKSMSWKINQVTYWLQEHFSTINLRGVIKKFSAWPSSVQNTIKIVFSSYSSKAQNTTCTIWLLGYKHFMHFSGRRLFAYDIEKNGYTQCNEMTILTDSFVSLHALLFRIRVEVVDPYVSLWITSCEIHFCCVTSVSFEKFFWNLCAVLSSPFSTPSDRQFVHMLKWTKLFIAQKSHFTRRVLSLGTISSKYYFNFILNRTRSGRELFDRPLVVLYLFTILLFETCHQYIQKLINEHMYMTVWLVRYPLH